MQLSTGDRKKVDKIKEELLKEFEKGQLNSAKIYSGGHENPENDVCLSTNSSFVGQRAFPGDNFRGRGRQPRGRGNFRGGYRASNKPLKRRSCQSTDHLVASCPTRFCEACGQPAHDSLNPVCQKYQ